MDVIRFRLGNPADPGSIHGQYTNLPPISKIHGYREPCPIWTPERLFAVSSLGYLKCLASIGPGYPDAIAGISSIRGKGQPISGNRPPWLASLARPVGDLV